MSPFRQASNKSRPATVRGRVGDGVKKALDDARDPLDVGRLGPGAILIVGSPRVRSSADCT